MNGDETRRMPDRILLSNGPFRPLHKSYIRLDLVRLSRVQALCVLAFSLTNGVILNCRTQARVLSVSLAVTAPGPLWPAGSPGLDRAKWRVSPSRTGDQRRSTLMRTHDLGAGRFRGGAPLRSGCSAEE